MSESDQEATAPMLQQQHDQNCSAETQNRDLLSDASSSAVSTVQPSPLEEQRASDKNISVSLRSAGSSVEGGEKIVGEAQQETVAVNAQRDVFVTLPEQHLFRAMLHPNCTCVNFFSPFSPLRAFMSACKFTILLNCAHILQTCWIVWTFTILLNCVQIYNLVKFVASCCTTDETCKTQISRVIELIHEHAGRLQLQAPETLVQRGDNEAPLMEQGSLEQVQQNKSSLPCREALEFFSENKQLIIRFAYDCPFEEIAEPFRKLISSLESMVRMSHFILFFSSCYLECLLRVWFLLCVHRGFN